MVQALYILICSSCKQVFARLHSRRRFYCTTCRRSTNLTPRCQFEITVSDNSGSAITTIAEECAEEMLHLTSEEIYDIRHAKKQKLPLASVRKRLDGKIFTIHMKPLSKTMDETSGKLIILSYTESENAITAPLSPTPMDTSTSRKRKIFNEYITVKATSLHGKLISEVETTPSEC